LIASRFIPAPLFPAKFKQGKYGVLSTLCGGAACSFIGASSAGKNNVHYMHDVFERGAKPTLTPYQELVQTTQHREEEAMGRRRLAIAEAQRLRAEEDAAVAARSR
jgi:hypothetical protein